MDEIGLTGLGSLRAVGSSGLVLLVLLELRGHLALAVLAELVPMGWLGLLGLGFGQFVVVERALLVELGKSKLAVVVGRVLGIVRWRSLERSRLGCFAVGRPVVVEPAVGLAEMPEWLTVVLGSELMVLDS